MSKNLLEEKEQAIIEYEQISPSQLAMEAQRGALVAKSQLEADVNMIKSINKERKKFNDLVMAVAKEATGKDGGKTPKEWRETLASGSGSSKRPPPPREHTVKWWPWRTTPYSRRWASPPRPCSESTSTWMSERIDTNSFRSGSFDPSAERSPSAISSLSSMITTADLTDAQGRPLAGNNGQPGGKFVATLNRGGFVSLARTMAEPSAQSGSPPAAIDAMVADGSLAGIIRHHARLAP